MVQLGVNIDHVATVRQARYRDFGPDLGEPDPVRAAHEAELGGADGITVHLREDRRHIQDRDVELLRRLIKVRLNLEMAATPEMIGIAAQIVPHTVMLVPEGRAEVTTEGGLDVAGEADRLAEVVRTIKAGGAMVSAFIDADPYQVEACAKAGFDICEVHTGPYADVWTRTGGDTRRPELQAELTRLTDAGSLIQGAGMRFNAGHALNYHNVGLVAGLAGVEELHIGHSIVSRAMYVGMRVAVGEMKRAMVAGAAG